MIGKRLLHFGFALSQVSLLACGGSDTTPAPDTNPTITFDMSQDVAIGAELHTCKFVRMPETGSKIYVSGGDYTTTPGTHHYLLFRTASDMPAQKMNTNIDCYEGDGVMQYERGYVSGGQLPSDSAAFPDGLGLPFQSGEILMLQGHFLNTTPSAVHAEIHVDLTTEPASSVDEDVGTFRFYDPFIYLEPQAKAKAAMRCHIDHDLTLISGGSHMHERGVGYQAFVDLAGQGFSRTPFYTTTDWQHPTPWEGAIKLTPGSAIRFGCDYDNPSPTPIIQGLSATDNEMCMFAGFYFPAAGADEENCVTMDMHGTGTRTCAETASCVSLCPTSDIPDFSPGHADVGPCWQECIVDSCPNVTQALFPELECSQSKCALPCATPGAACSQCLEVSCKPQVDTCQALACGE